MLRRGKGGSRGLVVVGEGRGVVTCERKGVNGLV